MRSKRSRIKAAKKAAATRKRNQAREKRVKASRARARETELRKIERALGEDFSSLAEARRALNAETAPRGGEITSLDDWESAFDFATEQGEEDYGGGLNIKWPEKSGEKQREKKASGAPSTLWPCRFPWC
jgi:hypothetical protein